MPQTYPNSAGPIEPSQVHVWHIAPGAGEPAMSAAIALLQPAELERMHRMRPGLAREEMVIGRACLRVLLGEALDCAPHEVRIEPGPDGKPHCIGKQAGDIHFNLGHSHGRILIALCREARVGVDIERMDSNVEIFEVAQANFAPGEVRAIKAAPTFERATKMFYRIWTAKEALLKAQGSGLLTPLDGFDLGAMESAAEQRFLVGPPETRAPYFLRTLPVAETFVAALALSAPDFQMTTHEVERHTVVTLLDSALVTQS